MAKIAAIQANHGDESPFPAALLVGLAEQGGKHPGDQADKDADGGIGVFFQEKGQDVCYPQETDDPAQDYRDQGRDMGLKILYRMGQKLHDRFVDAEDHAQYPAGNPRQHSAQADDYALQDADQEKLRSSALVLFSDA